jgi:hypothetical protein
MKRHLTISFSFLLFFIVLSCEDKLNDDEAVFTQFENATTNITTTESEEELVIIGNKTEDPHVMRHMEKALKELAKTDVRFSKIILKPNYKYVKISPINEKGIEDITALSFLNVYHYPLDYEIKKHGQKYDEVDKNSNFQSFWVVTPIDFSFSSNITEKLIEEVFMPFGNGKDEFIYDKQTEGLYKAIEEKANMSLYPKAKKAKISATYSGNISVEDDTLTYLRYRTTGTKVFLPLKGITVLARNLLTTKDTKTDNSGNFLFTRNW